MRPSARSSLSRHTFYVTVKKVVRLRPRTLALIARLIRSASTAGPSRDSQFHDSPPTIGKGNTPVLLTARGLSPPSRHSPLGQDSPALAATPSAPPRRPTPRSPSNPTTRPAVRHRRRKDAPGKRHLWGISRRGHSHILPTSRDLFDAPRDFAGEPQGKTAIKLRDVRGARSSKCVSRPLVFARL